MPHLPRYAMIIATLAGLARASDVMVSIEKTTDGFTLYTYTFDAKAKEGDLYFHLAVEAAASQPAADSTMKKADPKAAAVNSCVNPCYWWEKKDASQPVLVLSARTAETTASPADYSLSGSLKDTGTTTVPKPGFDPEFFSVVMGAGTLLTQRAATDYKIIQNNQTMAATNLGRKSVDLLVGGSFRLPMRGWALDKTQRPWSAFVSLKIAPGAEDTLNGFVFGVGYRVQKYLDLVAGVGLTPRNEPSIGLRRVAFNAVKANPSTYRGFLAEELLYNSGKAPYDGFPLTGADTKPIYQGEPLVKHYRTGLFVGVAFPLNMRGLIGGK